MLIDYTTGVINAALEKNISSAIGFRGLYKKLMILLLVGIGNLVDQYIFVGSGVARMMIICFYISNEGISVLENASKIGLPIPNKMKALLLEVRDHVEKQEESAADESPEEDRY